MCHNCCGPQLTKDGRHRDTSGVAGDVGGGEGRGGVIRSGQCPGPMRQDARAEITNNPSNPNNQIRFKRSLGRFHQIRPVTNKLQETQPNIILAARHDCHVNWVLNAGAFLLWSCFTENYYETLKYVKTLLFSNFCGILPSINHHSPFIILFIRLKVHLLPHIIDNHCNAPWLSNHYFLHTGTRNNSVLSRLNK